MKRYITRHGQVAETEFVGGHMFPAGDKPLSELGREQARLLGEHLLRTGFSGVILSSPYMRTMETAEIIAEILDLEIIPYAPIREIIRSENTASSFQGLTLAALREKYPRVSSKATLSYPWWELRAEAIEDVYRRAADCLSEVEELYGNVDLLFVGHGASVGGLIAAYGIPAWKSRLLCNCSLSLTYTDGEEGNAVYADTSFLPYEMRTSNFLTHEEFDRKLFDTPFEGEIKIPLGVGQIKGTRLLHISDTPSRLYPFYRELIKSVNPDIILHTGDMADEVKVGRNPAATYEYKAKLKRIAEILNDSGARLIITPGNNDLKEEIATLIPTAEIYASGEVITLDGEQCRVGHSVFSMTFDKKWHFYGHGSRGDDWKFEDNLPAAPCRFNACGASYLCSLSEGLFFKIKQSDFK